MWHEARRQERKIRGMLVDYRRRAERRRDFYERIKADPTQFLQIHGRQYKIHLDPAIAAAADSASAMMPWQGHSDNLIDRFDVRAHLDHIPAVKAEPQEEITFEERQINYERYRIIAQNSFLAINEEKFLKQLHMEEQFGYTESRNKKEPKNSGVAIGFNYEDGTACDNYQQTEDSDGNSDSDLDVDLSINVSKMDSFQAHEMNRHGRNFGMSSNDFYSFLTNDLEEAETFRLAKEEEHEKALFSGRKSRRERRAHREKRLANRVISPPSYAARSASPTYPQLRESKSASKSPSPDNSGKITYITSFGDEDEAPTTSKKKPNPDRKQEKPTKRNCSTERTVYLSRTTRSRSRSKYGRRRSRSRSLHRRRSHDYYRRSRSRSRSRKYYRRSRRRSSSSFSRSSSTTSSSSSSSSSSTSSYSTSSSSSRKSTSPKVVRKSISPKVVRKSISPKVVGKTISPKMIRKSKSKSPVKQEMVKESPPKIVSRYYGRKRSDRSSSDLSENGEGDTKPAQSPVHNEKWSGHGNSGTVTKKIGTPNMSIQERLKRKRQALLNKQFKADKIAEQLKTEREKQEQQNREDELREMAIKLRRRQREKRHAYDSNSSSSDSEDSSSNSTENRNKSPSVGRRSRERRESREKSREKETRRQSRSPRRYMYRDKRDDRRRDDNEREKRSGRLVDY